MADTRESTLPYEPGLDGVRGLAVGGVLLFHGGYLRGGFLGVDAFFVLSGYLITTLLLRELARTATIDFLYFYVRRLRRLMPAVVLVCVFVAVYAKFVAAPKELDTIRGDGIATMLYVANWRAIYAGRDYWALFRSPSPLEHTWSLAIEEQFYFVWPLAVWCAARWSKVSAVLAVRLVACIGVVASSAAMFALFVELDTARSYFGTDTRISSMFVGAILATLSIPVVISKAMRILVELLAATAAVFLAWIWLHAYGTDAWLYRGGFLLQAIAVGAVLVAVVHPVRGPLFWLARIEPLRRLGIVSYGVYLWHWPIYVWLSPARVGEAGWRLLMLRVGVTLAVATISYWCVERPVRRRNYSPRWVWTAVPVGIAVSVAALVVATSGYVALAAQEPDPIPDPISAVPTDEIRPQRILVVGNSIGYFLAKDGFAQGSSPKDPIVLNRGYIGCRLFREGTEAFGDNGPIAIEGPACIDTGWNEAVKSWQPDLVLRVMSSATDQRIKLEGHFVDACEEPYRRLAERTLRDEAKVLSASGAPVVYVTAATPSYPFLSEQSFLADKCLNDVVRLVASSAPHAMLADLQRFMCEHELQGCRVDLGDVVLRPDLVHYQGEGARIAMKWILAHYGDT